MTRRRATYLLRAAIETGCLIIMLAAIVGVGILGRVVDGLARLRMALR